MAFSSAHSGVEKGNYLGFVNTSPPHAEPDRQPKREHCIVAREPFASSTMPSHLPPHARPRGLASSLLFVVAIFITLVLGNSGRLSSADSSLRSSIATRQSTSTNASVLEVFQVSPPVLTPPNAECQETLMVHVFAFSYGQPFIGPYEPPACSFNRVTFNFTVVSAGRQFDRLGIMYFNDTEIFRTSTAEPTAAGIHWTYIKDMSNYLSLFQQPQKIIFDLGNLIDETYTASFNATLTATYFTEKDTPRAADLIVPVSSRKSASNGTSVFQVPTENATNTLSLPQNIERAVFSIASCGQSAEEFWWGNVLSSQVSTFGSSGATLYGYSPWREVQLVIDGMLAGVAWPFPVIFTGGVVPGFWRPIVGIDAYDLLEDEIDITPFLPLLCDGAEHTFEIRVVGIDDDGNDHGTVINSVGSYWLVSGKIFIWTDSAGTVTKGTLPTGLSPQPVISLSSSVGKTSNGTNSTLSYSVAVARHLSIASTVITSSGSKNASWEQTLNFTNSGFLDNQGNTEVNDQHTEGFDVSSSGYSKSFDYPLWCNQSYITTPGSDSFGIEAVLDRAKNVITFGESAFPSGVQPADLTGESQAQKRAAASSFSGTKLANRQNGTAAYTSIPAQRTSSSFGSTEQTLDFAGLQGSASAPSGSVELYHRHVLAVNLTLVKDEISFGDATVSYSHPPVRVATHDDYAPFTLQNLKGDKQPPSKKHKRH